MSRKLIISGILLLFLIPLLADFGSASLCGTDANCYQQCMNDCKYKNGKCAHDSGCGTLGTAADDCCVVTCDPGTTCNYAECTTDSTECDGSDHCSGDTYYDAYRCDGSGNCAQDYNDIGCCEDSYCNSDGCYSGKYKDYYCSSHSCDYDIKEQDSSSDYCCYTWDTSVTFESGNGDCCGDDSNEYYQGEEGDTDGSNSHACCDSSTDCVDDGSCYSDGKVQDVDGDGINEECDSGSWHECETSEPCCDSSGIISDGSRGGCSTCQHCSDGYPQCDDVSDGKVLDGTSEVDATSTSESCDGSIDYYATAGDCTYDGRYAECDGSGNCDNDASTYYQFESTHDVPSDNVAVDQSGGSSEPYEAGYCNSNWQCTDSTNTDDAYNNGNFGFYTQGYCDGSGTCDRSGSDITNNGDNNPDACECQSSGTQGDCDDGESDCWMPDASSDQCCQDSDTQHETGYAGCVSGTYRTDGDYSEINCNWGGSDWDSSGIDFESGLGNCCGDDSSEYYESRECNGGCTTDSSDKGCCDSTSDCVYGGNCYSDGWEGSAPWGPGEAYCESGVWKYFDNSLASFQVRDNTDNVIAKIDQSGNMWVYGSSTTGWSGSPSPDGDDFAIEDSSNNVAAWLEQSPVNLYIDNLHETTSSTPTSSGNFLIRDRDGNDVAWFDSSGDLYLKGYLTIV